MLKTRQEIQRLHRRVSSLCTVAVLPTEDRGIMVRFLAGARISSLFHSVQTCRGSPKPNYPWVLGSISLRIKQWGLNMASHTRLVLRLNMSAVIPPLQFMPSSCAKKQIDFHKFTLYNSHKGTITQQTGTVGKKPRILSQSYLFQISAELQYLLKKDLCHISYFLTIYIYIYIYVCVCVCVCVWYVCVCVVCVCVCGVCGGIP